MDTDTQAKRVAEISAVAAKIKEVDAELDRLCRGGVLPPERKRQFDAIVDGPLDTFDAYRSLNALADEWQAELDREDA